MLTLLSVFPIYAHVALPDRPLCPACGRIMVLPVYWYTRVQDKGSQLQRELAQASHLPADFIEDATFH